MGKANDRCSVCRPDSDEASERCSVSARWHPRCCAVGVRPGAGQGRRRTPDAELSDRGRRQATRGWFISLRLSRLRHRRGGKGWARHEGSGLFRPSARRGLWIRVGSRVRGASPAQDRNRSVHSPTAGMGGGDGSPGPRLAYRCTCPTLLRPGRGLRGSARARAHSRGGLRAQHTPQRPGITHDRTTRYQRAGYEVVWIFDHETSLGPYPAVRVERIAGTDRWMVVEGIWGRGRPTQRMDLCAFVAAVLTGGVSHELLPSYPAASAAPAGGLAGRSFPVPISEALVHRPAAVAAGKGRLYGAKEGPERAWVLAADLEGLRIRRDRAVATSRLMERLREAGVDARLSRIDDPSAAYATIVEAGGGRVAVHPRPSQAQEVEVRARLAGSTAVIARDEGDRQGLRGRLPAGPVRILLSDELDVAALASALTPPPQPPTATRPAPPASPPHGPAATLTVPRPRRSVTPPWLCSASWLWFWLAFWPRGCWREWSAIEGPVGIVASPDSGGGRRRRGLRGRGLSRCRSESPRDRHRVAARVARNRVLS